MNGYLEVLWVDPAGYQAELSAAAEHLLEHRLNVSIYNHQLGVLDPRLWPIARKSISDWKNDYLDECEGCAVQDPCGGFFTSSIRRHSAQIRRLHTETPAPDSPSIPTASLNA